MSTLASVKVEPALKMPTTVILVLQAVKVEPTLSLFVLASELPTMATSAVEVGLVCVPWK